VPDEAVESPDFWIDGAAGDEIGLVVVKSGSTRKPFSCTQANDPPTAVLEFAIPSDCGVVIEDPPLMHCPGTTERTEWTGFDEEVVFLLDDLCVTEPALCDFTLRGTSSIDPNDDLASWAVDFGDGTSATGDWTTTPPVDLVLTLDGCSQFSAVTLTVSDSAGNTASDTMKVVTGNCMD
ncbi:MAG: hypothetical protein ACRD0U_04310, partial [Acidimicrobiales bacterium]